VHVQVAAPQDWYEGILKSSEGDGHKLEEEATVVTQTVTVSTSANKADTEKAVKAAVEAEGFKPVEVTAVAARRLVGEDRRNIAMFKWAVTWVFTTFDKAVADKAYTFAEDVTKDGPKAKVFEATVKSEIKKEDPAAVTDGFEYSDPVKKSGGTTETPGVETTM